MAARTDGDPPRVAVAPVGVVVLLVGVLLVAVNGRYGYHRDELYFIACGRHPAWGYPDQGPVTPLLARFMDDLAPGSPTVLRLPAVASVLGATVLAALIARELGGRGFAQGLTALVVGTGVLTLLGGHLLVTATVDLVVWVAIVYLVVRILAAPPGARDRLWLVVGVVAGIGLLNKALPGVLLLGLLVGGVLTPAVRTRLRSRWLWAGAAVALALWAPYLVWQARNGWPQLELGRMIAREYGTAGQRAGFVVIQLVMFGFAGAYLWISGVSRSLRRRDPRLGPRRPSWQPVLAWAWLVVVAVLAVAAGQGYYGAGIYPPLIAAGAVGLEARLRSTTARALVVGGRRRARRRPRTGVPPAPARAHAAGLAVGRGRREPVRDGRLAPARRRRRRRLSLAAGRRPRGRRPPGRQLRRGRCDRPLRPIAGTAAGLQRAQRLRLVGSTAGRRPRRCRRRRGRTARGAPGLPSGRPGAQRRGRAERGEHQRGRLRLRGACAGLGGGVASGQAPEQLSTRARRPAGPGVSATRRCALHRIRCSAQRARRGSPGLRSWPPEPAAVVAPDADCVRSYTVTPPTVVLEKVLSIQLVIWLAAPEPPPGPNPPKPPWPLPPARK